ncbi:MAG: E3 binding domain-containing protein, partial [Xanthomonadaceae bacterium]|nr:E3 binding domain-containing protein [Xanthomonadaceae bacterium]
MADLKQALVPDIGHAGVPVIEVLVKVGDRVEKEQSLITLESDKATMEVPAPFAGVIRELKLKVGDEVSEGTVIALIEAEGAESAATAPASPAPAAAAAKPAAPAPAAPAPAQEPAAAPAAAAVVATPVAARAPLDAAVVMPGDAPYASPAIRAFARELGVDISQVKGSGRGGRIQRE